MAWRQVMVVFTVAAVMHLGRTRGSVQDKFRTDEALEGEPKRRLCGWRLANKLNRVCKGVYNKPDADSNLLFYRGRRG